MRMTLSGFLGSRLKMMLLRPSRATADSGIASSSVPPATATSREAATPGFAQGASRSGVTNTSNVRSSGFAVIPMTSGPRITSLGSTPRSRGGTMTAVTPSLNPMRSLWSAWARIRMRSGCTVLSTRLDCSTHAPFVTARASTIPAADARTSTVSSVRQRGGASGLGGRRAGEVLCGGAEDARRTPEEEVEARPPGIELRRALPAARLEIRVLLHDVRELGLSGRVGDARLRQLLALAAAGLAELFELLDPLRQEPHRLRERLLVDLVGGAERSDRLHGGACEPDGRLGARQVLLQEPPLRGVEPVERRPGSTFSNWPTRISTFPSSIVRYSRRASGTSSNRPGIRIVRETEVYSSFVKQRPTNK